MKKNYKVTLDYSAGSLKEGSLYKIQGKHIDIQERGIYLTTSKNYHLSLEDRERLHLTVSNKKIDLQDKKLYRYPKLTLPRNKVNLLKDRFNLKLVRNSDKADYKVISRKLLNNLITFSWNYHYTFKQMFEIFKGLKNANLLTESGLEAARNFVEHGDRDGMYMKENQYYYNADPKSQRVIDTIEKIVKSARPDWEETRYLRHMVVDKDGGKLDNYLDMMNDSHKLVWDTDILDIVDEDLAVLENTEYERIQQMIQSEDIETRTLAVEMLANCNINKSF